jgi:hypothetical protein
MSSAVFRMALEKYFEKNENQNTQIQLSGKEYFKEHFDTVRETIVDKLQSYYSDTFVLISRHNPQYELPLEQTTHERTTKEIVAYAHKIKPCRHQARTFIAYLKYDGNMERLHEHAARIFVHAQVGGGPGSKSALSMGLRMLKTAANGVGSGAKLVSKKLLNKRARPVELNPAFQLWAYELMRVVVVNLNKDEVVSFIIRFNKANSSEKSKMLVDDFKPKSFFMNDEVASEIIKLFPKFSIRTKLELFNAAKGIDFKLPSTPHERGGGKPAEDSKMNVTHSMLKQDYFTLMVWWGLMTIVWCVIAVWPFIIITLPMTLYYAYKYNKMKSVKDS